MIGAGACLLSARKARSKVGKSAPVVLVTSIGSLAIGHWVTAALPLGVRVVVIEGLSVPAGAHGAPPWAIGLRAPPRNEVNRGGAGTHTQDRHTNLTNQPQNQPHPPTQDCTRQTTPPTPKRTRHHKPHHSPDQAPLGWWCDRVEGGDGRGKVLGR